MKNWYLIVDVEKCENCNNCFLACKDEHVDNDWPGYSSPMPAQGQSWINVERRERGEFPFIDVAYLPVPCMHCENAPCEYVCPVGATVHSPEGLNEMIYNRCVGTRYCSNNCPYKVRRFNSLEYNAHRELTLNMQKNPNVTVRSRGVMEKCT